MTNAYSEKGFRYLSNSISMSGYFIIHRSLIERYGLQTAAFLHYLINFHQRVIHSKWYKWNDGWFFCTVERLNQEMLLKQDSQLRIVKKLVAEKVIETKKSGLPARRFFRLNSDLIGKIITDWKMPSDETRPLDTQETRPLDVKEPRPHSNKDIIVRKEVCGAGGPTAHTAFGLSKNKGPRRKRRTFHIDGFPSKAAGNLREVLMLHNSDLANDVDCIELLAKSIYNITVKRKISEQRIKAVIRWLKDHYDEQYTPKLYRKNDFDKNFSRIEDAMKRWCLDNDQPLPENKDRQKTISMVFAVTRRLGDERGHTHMDWDDDDIADALEELGLPANSVSAEELG